MKRTTPISPVSVLDLIPAKKTRKQRNYKVPTISFYLHPRLAERGENLRAALKRIAEIESTSMAEISQTLIAYAAHCYEQGGIQLQSRPNPELRKMSFEWTEADTWARDLSAVQTSTPKSQEKKYAISFRWEHDRSSPLIAKIAEHHAVSAGEVLLVLLEHAIERYKQGNVSLKQRPSLESWGEDWATAQK